MRILNLHKRASLAEAEQCADLWIGDTLGLAERHNEFWIIDLTSENSPIVGFSSFNYGITPSVIMLTAHHFLIGRDKEVSRYCVDRGELIVLVRMQAPFVRFKILLESKLIAAVGDLEVAMIDKVGVVSWVYSAPDLIVNIEEIDRYRISLHIDDGQEIILDMTNGKIFL